MPRDSVAAAMLAVLAIGSLYWAWQEFRAARDGKIAARHRRVSLYHALVLDSFSVAFAIMAIGRLWPAVHPLAPLIGLAPPFLVAAGVRFHRGFATWLLARIA